MPDQLSAEEAIAHDQASGLPNIERVLTAEGRARNGWVPVSFELRVLDSDGFFRVTPGKNAILILEKRAVADSKINTTGCTLISNAGRISAKSIGNLSAHKAQPIHGQARLGQNNPLPVRDFPCGFQQHLSARIPRINPDRHRPRDVWKVIRV